jgi:threonine dehydrogenase-like Zn-dependent dehydrogenase
VVPPDLREIAVLVEPLTIAEKGLLQGWWVERRLPWLRDARLSDGAARGHRAAVLGAGAVGILGTMALLRAGFETYVYDRATAPSVKSRLVEALGARYISPDPSHAEELAALRGTVEVIYEAVGAPKVTAEMLRLLAANGICVLTGVPGSLEPFLVEGGPRVRDLVLKNQVVLGVVNAGKEAYTAAIRDLGDFADRWPNEIRSLIAHRYPVEDYREPLLGRPEGIKNVLTFAR